MATKERKKLGPVTAEARRVYLARLGPDAKWGRPTEQTAGSVWTLLKNRLPYRLDDLLPKSKSRTRPARAAYEQAVLVAKQSLVIALDCAISASDRSKMLTQNLLLEALAKYWSIRFRRVQRQGVHTLYDVREETARRVWRELILAGVRVDTLWQIMAGEWSRTEEARNPLYWVSRVQGPSHALGWRVNVRPESPTVRGFEGTLAKDEQYRRRAEQRRVVFAEEREKELLALDVRRLLREQGRDAAVGRVGLRPRRVRREICAERPYNVVNLGDVSERVLEILEQSQIKFNVEVFRHDYETIAKCLDAHFPSPWPELSEYRKLRAFLSSYRRVYRQTKSIPLETIDEWEQWGEQPGDGGLRPNYLSGHRWIRSRFFRAKNRRFHALDFWPETVPKIFRDRWFGVWVDTPEQEVVAFDLDGVPERVVTAAGAAHGRFVARDISSSQTQILAVFLGLPELEALATSTNPKFKHWLAQELWRLHENTAGGLLAEDGYSGPSDERLVEFIKAHWMRRMYGSELHQIIWKLGKERAKYGPGWRTGVDDALRFLTSLPPWADEVENFLEMCKHLARTYHLKDGDINRGVVFHDPLDGTEVRWHHAQRGRFRLGFGHFKVEIHPPGANHPRETFWPLRPGTIDRKKLGQFIPPCLIHMLDAFFSGLVIQELRAAGITDVIATHDSWFVPETFRAEGSGSVFNGRDVLEDAISEVGATWFEGLEDVYDRLVHYLGDNPTFGHFVREIKSRWEKRVQDQRWPRFTVG